MQLNESIIAQDSPVGFPLNNHYSTEEIYLSQQNWDFKQGKKGRIFIANGSGLIVFDGGHWNFYHIENNKAIYSIDISDSVIFVGGSGEFGYFKANKINELEYNSISKFLSDSVNFVEVWQTHATKHGVYFRTDSTIFRWFNDSLNIIETGRVYKSFKVNDEIIFTKKNMGLKKIVGGKLEPFDNPEHLNDRALMSIISEPTQNRHRFIYWTGEIFDVVGNKFQRIYTDVDSLLLNGRVRDALRVNKQYLYLTKYGGIVSTDLDNNLLNIFNEERNLKSKDLYKLFLDRQNQVWIGSGEGVEKLDYQTPVVKYERSHGIFGAINSILRFDSTLYVGSTSGLFELDQLDIGVAQFQLVLDSWINSLSVYNSKLYIATSDALYRKQSEGFETIFQGSVTGLQTLDDFGLVFSDTDGIYILDRGTENGIITLYKNIGYGDQILSSHANKICGLNKGKGEVICISQLDEDLLYKHYSLSISINSISFLENKLTVSTSKGVYVVDNTKNALVLDKRYSNELSDTTNQIYYITKDQFNSNKIWVRIDRTTKVFSLNNPDSLIAVPYANFDPRITIRSIYSEMNNSWFGGNSILYNQNTEVPFEPGSYKTNITGIFVENDSLIYGGFGELVNLISLPFEDNEIRFTYAAASYIDPERNTYSYKLEGFDSDWSDWSLETQKDYTNIPEGDYVFKVRSRNVYEVEGSMDSIPFTILPPWYRTWWAYVLYLLSSSMVLFAAYKIRINQLLKVERMRTKIASDLHDEVSATLTGISYFAEAVQKNEKNGKKDHFINLISESAGDAKEKISDIVWAITPENDNWEGFLSKCRRYASDLLESSELDYELKIAENIPGKLKMQVRQHLWMIFKELLTNVVRHSKATRVDVIMDVENEVLKLIIQDNGKGIEHTKDKYGNGLNNVRNRADAIKASIELDSEQNMGTRWRLELKL